MSTLESMVQYNQAERKKVAILVADECDALEVAQLGSFLQSVYMLPVIVSPCMGHVSGIGDRNNHRIVMPVDQRVSKAKAEDFQALYLPGGNRHIQILSRHRLALRFVEEFFMLSKPVGINGDASIILSAANILSMREVAVRRKLHPDLERAGAWPVEAHRCIDHGLLSFRNAHFNSKDRQMILDLFSKHTHWGQTC